MEKGSAMVITSNLPSLGARPQGASRLPPFPRHQYLERSIVTKGEGSKNNIFKASQRKYFPWGSKNKYLRQKKLESLVLYDPCNSLETKPSISVVFASFWKWSLSPVRFLQDIGPGNRAFAGLDAAVSTASATLWSSNLLFSMLALKLTLFKVCLCLV